MNIYHGIGASEGVVIGAVLKINSSFVNYPRVHLTDKEQISFELERVKNAQDITEQQINSVMKSSADLLGEEINEVFTGYQMFVRDKRFVPAIEKQITSLNINAEWALINVLTELEGQFKNIADPYIRSRYDDVRQLGKRLMENLMSKPQLDLSHLDSPVIIICEEISPADAFHLNTKYILGIATELGGETSHSSILARAMNIPAVVGVKKILTRVLDETRIILDGLSGEIIVDPTEEIIKQKLDKKEQFNFYQGQLQELVNEDCKLADGKEIALAANLDFLEEIDQVIGLRIPAIGLVRTEFLFLHENSIPGEDEQYNTFKKIITDCNQIPVAIRTWDIGADKTSKLFTDLNNEANPALGLRAIRLCLKHPKVFRTQIRAIVKASKHGPIALMLPMITRLDEIIETKSIVQEEQINLGISDNSNLTIGCMVETPSSTYIVDDILDLVDFISIGSNDLIQYALAVDRLNEHVADFFAPFHPAILKMLEKIIIAANRRKKPVSICGELAADPIMQMFLIGVGDITFSMSPNKTLRSKRILGKVDSKTCKKITFQFISKHSLEESNLYVEQLREKYLDAIELEAGYY
ncbi:MAG: phosphoenolpyruvate--protein phosphotransferase [Proteobacteria bacterium]|nr:phosphoenolpyruvate--protein phosphotransferase [Pseudomonadota bacterium]